MNFPLRGWILVLAGCFFTFHVARAQDTPPASFGKEFSADMIMTDAKGLVMKQKLFGSDDKIRTQLGGDIPMVVIVRPDLQKVYSVMDAQKMVMVMPYDPQKLGQQVSLATGLNGKYESLGSALVEGVPCIKYKVTATDGKVFDLWVDTIQKIPIKMAAEDQSFTMLIKNYQAGPQDAALFEPPAGYQVVNMPALPGIPANSPAVPTGQP